MIVPTVPDQFFPLEYALLNARRIAEEFQQKAREKIPQFDEQFRAAGGVGMIPFAAELKGASGVTSKWHIYALNEDGRREVIIL